MKKNLLRIPVQIFIWIFMLSFAFGQNESARANKRLNAKIDREIVRVDSLNTQIRILLPDLKNALEANLRAKQQTDSVAILLINRINTIQNKMLLLEDKAAFIDSVNFQILSQLVMVENKIVTLATSFTEMYNLRNAKPGNDSFSRISPPEYKRIYIGALSDYQNGNYEEAIQGFASLITSDYTNELADNSQYWLAECYYSQKNYKRAVIEFEKVFTFPGTDKDDDAQLKLGHAYLSMDNRNKSLEEYQRLVDYFPGSEFLEIAQESIKQLTSE